MKLGLSWNLKQTYYLCLKIPILFQFWSQEYTSQSADYEQGKECFICKKGGHRAKDCPEKSQGGSESSRMCLKCGDSGHDMLSCWNNYSADDLKVLLKKLLT